MANWPNSSQRPFWNWNRNKTLNTTTIISFAVMLLAAVASTASASNASNAMTALEIMQEVYKRHEQFPYIYEEQVMVLIDRAGNRDTRKLRRYSRLDSADSGRYLLLFDDPPEVRGVGLLTTVGPEDNVTARIYLPAYGPQFIESIGQNQANSFLGTDFSVNDLLPEPLDKYEFQRREDIQVGDNNYFVLDVFSKPAQQGQQPLKRHYVRQDNYYIMQTDTFDRHGRLYKQQTQHDLKPLGGTMWRADMILIRDLKQNHQSLVKITRRVFSRDYVPEELFTLEWLVNNQRLALPESETDADNQDQKTADGIDVGQLSEIVY